MRDSLERQRKILVPEHEHALYTAANLALALQSQCKYQYAEAEPLVRSEGHAGTPTTAHALTSLLVGTGKHAAAEELGRGTLAQANRMLGPDHPTRLEIARALATALGHQGQTAEQ